MPRFLKSERLLKKCEFDAVYKNGRRSHSKNFYMIFLSGAMRRIGLTVGSKAGKAFERNRIKRVIREAFRLNKEKFPVGDIVVGAKTGAADIENAKIREEVLSLAAKIK